MQRRSLFTGAAGLALAIGLAGPATAETMLKVMTAGDQNMVDYVNEFLAPKFEAEIPA